MSKETGVIEALRTYIDRKVIPGAVVAVVGRDRMLAIESIGHADLANGTPMKSDSMFWIASMTKPITATGLMLLVDEGKVNVDDPVEKYIPEFKNQWVLVAGDDEFQFLRRPKKQLCVRHLLGHTAGMPGRAAMEFPAQDVIPLSTAVRLYSGTPLFSEPGDKYAYCNPGPNTVGRIIEVVSGMPYETFMKTRLFDPLGMKDTAFVLTENQAARVAKAYKPNADATALEEAGNQWMTQPLTNPARQPFPGGGLYSTAPDIARFCQMLLNGGVFEGKRIVTEPTLARFTQQQQGECLDGSYGLCFALFEGTFGHGGAFATNLNVDPKRGLATVYMVQLSGALGDAGAGLGAFRAEAVERFAPKCNV